MPPIKSHKSRSRSKSRAASRLVNSSHEVEIQDLNHDGMGVSHDLEKVLFVAGALPGEKVKATIVKEQRNYAEARLDDVLQASDERVVPACTYYKKCGGCQLQHLDSGHQLSHKQNNIDQNLRRHLKLKEVPWQAPITSSGFGYRRRARLGVRYRSQQDEVIVGFREEANTHLSSIEACLVLTDALSALIAPLHEILSQLDARSRITQAEMIEDDQGPVIILRHLKTVSASDVDRLKHWAVQQSVDVWLQPDDPDGLHCIWPEPARALYYHLADSRLAFQVKDFIQGNQSVNRAMVEQAIDWLAPEQHHTVLDLFAGIGNFSVPLAKHCQKVVAVEGVSEMVARIEHNAELNGTRNIEARAMNLENLDRLSQLPKADLILLDPPRTGAAALMPWLSQQQAKILYIACEPSALVRDAKPLLEAGFKLSKLCVMDMFPQTRHVESMALFEWK